MAPVAIERARAIEAVAKQLPQVPVTLDHVLHGGMYARTVRIPAGVMLTGALIKIPTVLVFSGHATVYVGDGTAEVDGYQVIPAAAGRKQVFIAHEDTDLTMLFPTSAQSVEEAEREFTDEWRALLRSARDTVTITGD